MAYNHAANLQLYDDTSGALHAADHAGSASSHHQFSFNTFQQEQEGQAAAPSLSSSGGALRDAVSSRLEGRAARKSTDGSAIALSLRAVLTKESITHATGRYFSAGDTGAPAASAPHGRAQSAGPHARRGHGDAPTAYEIAAASHLLSANVITAGFGLRTAGGTGALAGSALSSLASSGLAKVSAASLGRSASGGSRVRCFRCKQQGHTAIQCPSGPGYQPCYLCARVGHGTRECELGSVCYLCDRPGHVVADCPRAAAEMAAARTSGDGLPTGYGRRLTAMLGPAAVGSTTYARCRREVEANAAAAAERAGRRREPLAELPKSEILVQQFCSLCGSKNLVGGGACSACGSDAAAVAADLARVTCSVCGRRGHAFCLLHETLYPEEAEAARDVQTPAPAGRAWRAAAAAAALSWRQRAAPGEDEEEPLHSWEPYARLSVGASQFIAAAPAAAPAAASAAPSKRGGGGATGDSGSAAMFAALVGAPHVTGGTAQQRASLASVVASELLQPALVKARAAAGGTVSGSQLGGASAASAATLGSCFNCGGGGHDGARCPKPRYPLVAQAYAAFPASLERDAFRVRPVAHPAPQPQLQRIAPRGGEVANEGGSDAISISSGAASSPGPAASSAPAMSVAPRGFHASSSSSVHRHVSAAAPSGDHWDDAIVISDSSDGGRSGDVKQAKQRLLHGGGHSDTERGRGRAERSRARQSASTAPVAASRFPAAALAPPLSVVVPAPPAAKPRPGGGGGGGTSAAPPAAAPPPPPLQSSSAVGGKRGRPSSDATPAAASSSADAAAGAGATEATDGAAASGAHKKKRPRRSSAIATPAALPAGCDVSPSLAGYSLGAPDLPEDMIPLGAPWGAPRAGSAAAAEAPWFDRVPELRAVRDAVWADSSISADDKRVRMAQLKKQAKRMERSRALEAAAAAT